MALPQIKNKASQPLQRPAYVPAYNLSEADVSLNQEQVEYQEPYLEIVREPLQDATEEINDVTLIPAELESSSSFLNRISFFTLLTLLASFFGFSMGIIFGMLLLTGKLDMYHEDVVLLLKSVKPLIIRYFL